MLLDDFASLSLRPKMYEDMREQLTNRPRSSSAETEFHTGSYRMSTIIKVDTDRDIDLASYVNSTVRQVDEAKIVRRAFRNLANHLCNEHPSIRMDAEVLGGTPHIEGTRLSVGKVLSKLYLHGSIQAVIEIHKPHISEAQVKEAIAYAQDFLEMAGDSNETP
jgi:uncharacterized protein (DUF433 family)